MDSKNETCVQRARFFFYFFEEAEWKEGNKPPLEVFVKLDHPGADDIRSLRDYIARRLDRVSEMVEILTRAHQDWAITPKKDYILLETESFDFNDALKLLKDKGFADDEFILKVEYTRKWGVL